MPVAAVMTYDSLSEDIGKYLERTDPATLDMIPTFIMLAEQKLASDIKFLGNLKVVVTNVLTNDPILPKPARWRKTVSMNIRPSPTSNIRQPVMLRSYEYCRNYIGSRVTFDVTFSETGLPQYYCDYDYDHWFLSPPPNAAYTIEIAYYERPQPLDSTNQTNWFTNYAPQAMLYGTLLQATSYVKNDVRIPLWQTQYDGAIASLKQEDVTRIGDRQGTILDK